MNVWYLISLIIVGIGVISLISLILASIFSISKIAQEINNTINRIQQQQMNPLQVQVDHLNSTMNRIKLDVEQKKFELMDVSESIKGIWRNIQELTSSSRLGTKRVVDKVKTDPNMQAQIDDWTKMALRYLKRNA